MDPLIKRQMVMLAVFLFRSIQFFSGETFYLSVASRFKSTSPMLLPPPGTTGSCAAMSLRNFLRSLSGTEPAIVEH